MLNRARVNSTLKRVPISTNVYFCRYIFGDKSPWKYIWVLVVLGSNIIAGFFIFTAATDFTRRSVLPGSVGQCRQGLEVSATRDWRSVPPGTGGQCHQGLEDSAARDGGQCRQGLEVGAARDWRPVQLWNEISAMKH